MAIHTDIEWCDSSLNLAMGCDGCELWNPARGVKHCYAGVLTGKYGGRHVRGQGFEDDCTKISNAAILGWRVLLATVRQVEDGTVFGWIDRLFKG
jgi:protein gp37